MDVSTPTVSPLRQRMLEDMRMRKFEPKTQAGYLRAVRKLAKFLGRSPDTASVEDLRRFQMDLVDEGASLSRVGVIRPPGVGIFRPLGRAPNAISKRVAEVAILQHEWGPLEAPFWTLARPSDHGTRGRQVRCNMRCGAAGPAWPRRAAGWWQTRGPIRQSPGCW